MLVQVRFPFTVQWLCSPPARPQSLLITSTYCLLCHPEQHWLMRGSE